MNLLLLTENNEPNKPNSIAERSSTESNLQSNVNEKTAENTETKEAGPTEEQGLAKSDSQPYTVEASIEKLSVTESNSQSKVNELTSDFELIENVTKIGNLTSAESNPQPYLVEPAANIETIGTDPTEELRSAKSNFKSYVAETTVETSEENPAAKQNSADFN